MAAQPGARAYREAQVRILKDSWMTATRASLQVPQRMVRISRRRMVRKPTRVCIAVVNVYVGYQLRCILMVHHRVRTTHPTPGIRRDVIIVAGVTRQRMTAVQRCVVDNASDRASLMVRVRSSLSGHISRIVHPTTDGMMRTSWRI